MGVHWAKAASKTFEGRVEILDLRTLNPLDWEAVVASVKRHNKALVLTEEPLLNSFAESLAGRISKECFRVLDAPVMTYGAVSLPAIPLNADLEKQMLPTPEKVETAIAELLNY
jgi:2-oxoisovalerate dehydrogenase E1 component